MDSSSWRTPLRRPALSTVVCLSGRSANLRCLVSPRRRTSPLVRVALSLLVTPERRSACDCAPHWRRSAAATAETGVRSETFRTRATPSRSPAGRQLYEHVLTGYNWRLTEMQAAMGRVQLRKLDTILARKRANAAWMNRRLETVPNVTPPYQVPNTRPTHMLYTCLLEGGRDSVLEFLLSSGIEARVYFPPAHLQAIFEGQARSLPVTEAVAQRMLSIPMHSLLTREELALVADCLETGARQVRASR